MAEQSFPFENIDTTESQFSEWATNFQETGLQGSPDGSELGITVTGSDLNLTIAAGQAFIRGHYYINTSDLVLPVTSAGVNTRIDIVVVELDPEANTIVTKIVSGEAVSADPVAPTLTQSATGIYQLPISTLTIPNSTVVITAGMLTDTRTFMGNRIGIWTTDTRPANPTAYQTLGYNTTIEAHESWNGTAWVGFFDPITTEGDLVVGDDTGQASRLGVGANDQVLTVVSGAPAWADAVGGAPTTFQVLPGTIAVYEYPFESEKTYGFVYYGTGLTIKIYDADYNELSVLPSGDTIQYLLEQPADAAKLIMSTTSDLPAQVSFFEITPTTSEETKGVFYIDTTKSVTIDSSYTAYLIGGGGGGGGGRTNGSAGGGGGAGYIASGVIEAGTYTATVGGTNGGATSIGSLTAAGGSSGGIGSSNSGGTGGDGGSGGGAGSTTTTYNPGGGNGANGGGPGGDGSGVALVSTVYSLLLGYGPAAATGTGAAGFYRGGRGGIRNWGSTRGTDGTGFGGGGGGGQSDKDWPGSNSSGGTGQAGLIVLVEVT